MVQLHWKCSVQFSSVAQSCPTLRPHESQHARPPCPSPTPGVHSDSRPLSQWCYPAISSSVIPFSSCPQSLPVSESFPMSQLFAWGGQSTGVSTLASVLPKESQGYLQNGLAGSPCSPRDSQESSPIPQFKSINIGLFVMMHFFGCLRLQILFSLLHNRHLPAGRYKIRHTAGILYCLSLLDCLCYLQV